MWKLRVTKVVDIEDEDGGTYVFWRVPEPWDDYRSVEAIWWSFPSEWQWYVVLGVAEFIREEPLESEMIAAVEKALRGVRGVRDFNHEDREKWAIDGNPRGKDLVRAVRAALEPLVPRFISHVASLQVDES